MTLGAVLPYWPDRPAEEAIAVARVADTLGYDELWLGQMATFDAFALATAVGLQTKRITLTIGPLAVAVRDPVSLYLGAASVASLTGRAVRLALGPSTPVVVSQWHGRPWERVLGQLRNSMHTVRPLLAGNKASGFRPRLPPVSADIAVAAFGDGTVRIAGELADRMVVNLVNPAQVLRLAEKLAKAAAGAGRSRPPLAAWIIVAVDPGPEAYDQARRALVPYLGAPGYGEMFSDAGFGELVEDARSGRHPRDLFEAVPVDLLHALGAFGSREAVRARLDEYRAAGVDDICVVPLTAADPGGERTLRVVAEL